MASRSLDAYLYGEEEEDPRFAGMANPSMGIGEPAADPVAPETLAPELMAPSLAPMQATPPPGAQPRLPSPKQADGSWSPDWLAAFAAFTRNPALMQKLQAREAERAAERKRQAEIPMQEKLFAMKEAAEKRAAEKHAAELPYYGARAQSQQAFADESAQRTRLRAEANDPNSETSKNFAQAAAASLETQAKLLAQKSPEIAEKVWGAAKALVGKSYEQVKATLSAMGSIGNKALDEGHRKSAESQGWARINQDESQFQRSLEDRKEGRADAHDNHIEARMAKDQDKLNKEVEDADWTRDMLIYAGELKKGVNTGPIATRAQEALQAFGLSSAEFDNLSAVMATVSNRIIKELSGSNVTGNEWMRMQAQLAQLRDDDPNFERKLALLMKQVESIKNRAINRYQRYDSGETVDRSNTARRVTGRTPATNPGERGKGAGPDDDKAERARAALKDPNASPKAKAGAKAWLEANGYGP